MPSLSEYNIMKIYSKVEDYETENKTRVNTWIQVTENDGSLNFNFLITQNCMVLGRQELGLPTSSSAVHLWKMMPRTMFWSMQTFHE